MLTIVPIKRAEAQAFIEKHHRHRGKVTGAIFQLACANVETEKIVGVTIVGRPVARHLDDGWTVEVNRCCTDGTRNACSMLYSAAWRAAKALGYTKIITYTLTTESGASLRGAGWKKIAETPGSPWNNKQRPRIDTTPWQRKFRWEQEKQ